MKYLRTILQHTPLLVLIVGGFFAAGAFAFKLSAAPAASSLVDTYQHMQAAETTVPQPAVPQPAPSDETAPPAKKPAYSTVQRPIAFSTRSVQDAHRLRGTRTVIQNGKNGVKTFTYEVTSDGSSSTSKRLVSAHVTTAPVSKIVAIGTRAPNHTAQPQHKAPPSPSHPQPACTKDCTPAPQPHRTLFQRLLALF